MPKWLIICYKQCRDASDPDAFLQQQGIYTNYRTQSSDPKSLNRFHSLPSPTSRSSTGRSACAHHPRSLQRTRQGDSRCRQSGGTLSPGGRWEAPSLLAAERDWVSECFQTMRLDTNILCEVKVHAGVLKTTAIVVWLIDLAAYQHGQQLEIFSVTCTFREYHVMWCPLQIKIIEKDAPYNARICQNHYVFKFFFPVSK